MDIIDIVSNYIELKKSGANFKANCPFHGEKTPSFVISPSKQIFHCFGCQKGGDAIQFVMEYEKLNYPEALEKIADMIGITVEHQAGSQNTHDYKKFMEQLNGFYMKNLDDDHRAYLYSRGLSEETIRAWGIGYAPRNPKTQQFLEENFLSIPLAEEMGVMVQTEGRIYSRFSERAALESGDSNSISS